MTTAIILAGGKSTRMGDGVDKAFLSLVNKPMVAWSLLAFERSPEIDRIVLVVRKDQLLASKAVVKMFGISKRTAAMERNIGLNLSEEGKQLLDSGKLGKVSADAIAGLKPEDQAELLDAITSGKIKGTENIKQAVKNKKRGTTGTKTEKQAADHAKAAVKALKKALDAEGIVDLSTVAEIRALASQLREKAIEETS